MKEYSVGDKVWYIPRGYGIIIQCTITEIDDYFRQKDAASYLFYELDEPVGHSVDNSEIFDSLKEARENVEFNPNMNIYKYRASRIRFIVSTWDLSPEQTGVEKERLWSLYPEKEYNKEWFNG